MRGFFIVGVVYASLSLVSGFALASECGGCACEPSCGAEPCYRNEPSCGASPSAGSCYHATPAPIKVRGGWFGQKHFHHHHYYQPNCGCNSCCNNSRGGSDRGSDEGGFSRGAAIPSGPIVESYPMMPAMMPAMFAMPAMPVMYGAQARQLSYEEPRSRSRSRSRDTQDCCEELEERMDDLDERVDALDLRMRSIQRSVEIQTRILEEIKAQGKIGGKQIPEKAAE